MNWIPLDKDNPPTSIVLFYFPANNGCRLNVFLGGWWQLTKRGQEIATHYHPFVSPAEVDDA